MPFCARLDTLRVMAAVPGLVPAINVFAGLAIDVDARDKRGHDESNLMTA